MIKLAQVEFRLRKFDIKVANVEHWSEQQHHVSDQQWCYWEINQYVCIIMVDRQAW